MPNNYKQIAKLAIKKIDGEISPGELQELFAWAAASPKRRRLLQDLMRDAALVRKAASFKTYDWKTAWNEMAALNPDLEPVSVGEALAGASDDGVGAAGTAIGADEGAGDVVGADEAPGTGAGVDEGARDAAGADGASDDGAADDGISSDEPRPPAGTFSGLRLMPFMPRRRWIAAASIVFILAFGGVLLWRFGGTGSKRGPQDMAVSGSATGHDGDRQPSPAGSAHSPPLSPGGPKATLTLADHRSLRLDAIAIGMVGSEGHIDIVKPAAGSIMYSLKGAPPPGILTPSLAWEKSAFNTLSTPRGGQFLLVLPEGSRVWLNADSRLRYPLSFNDSSRDVELDGEAFFDIHAAYSPKGKKIPFVVHASSLATSFIVTGTRFNVSAYDDDPFLSATLVNGSIRVNEGGATILMRPGENYAREGPGKPGHLSSADTSADLAWTRGRFRFRNQPLHSIMRQVARWYDADVHFADSIPGRFTVAGSRDEPVSNLLQKLSSINAVHFDIDGSTITISSR